MDNDLINQLSVPLPPRKGYIPTPDNDVPLPPPSADPMVPKPYGFTNTHTVTENHPKGLRTFASDMAEAVRVQEGSVIKIAIAESQKKEREAQGAVTETRSNTAFAIFSVLLLVVGVGVFAYAFISSQPKTAVVVAPNPLNQSIVINDGSVELDVTSRSRQDIAKGIHDLAVNNPLTEGQILNINPTSKATGVVVKPTAPELLKMLGTSMSSSLVHALGDRYMIGSYKEVNGGKPFIIFTTNTFDYAYSGMLAWEKKMVDDLFVIFDIPITGDNSYLLSKKFGDAIIKNQDIRVLADKDGATLFLYVFVNNNDMIIVAKDEDTIIELLKRMGDLKVSQ